MKTKLNFQFFQYHDYKCALGYTLRQEIILIPVVNLWYSKWEFVKWIVFKLSSRQFLILLVMFLILPLKCSISRNWCTSVAFLSKSSSKFFSNNTIWKNLVGNGSQKDTL